LRQSYARLPRSFGCRHDAGDWPDAGIVPRQHAEAQMTGFTEHPQPSGSADITRPSADLTLRELGWSDAWENASADQDGAPGRVSSVHRDHVDVLTPDGAKTLALPGKLEAGDIAVGDWLLFDPIAGRVSVILERTTMIQRRAAGHRAVRQLIAANVDTLAIVTSCNDDYNEARLERYLALAASAGCAPVIVLTKPDLCDDADQYRRRATALSPISVAVMLNAKEPDATDALAPWCKDGQTLALLGSSGVGKTTLSNALTGRTDATQGIRSDDAKGRHTTTSRALWRTLAGGWLVDTPGMRELQLTGASDGIDAVFEDLADLEAQCRFSNCGHDSEPGCAIRAAIESGDLDVDRLARYRKLQSEDARNSETLAESRSRDRSQNKIYNEGRARGRHKRRR
jgi:ribosome biogenesis GTPase